jgi:tetratricopeptide (TPR) repeat protein
MHNLKLDLQKKMKRSIALLIYVCIHHLASGQPFLQRGVNSYNEGDYKQAVNWFNWAIKADSTDAVAYANRAHAKRSLNDFGGALTDFTTATKLRPSDGTLHFWVGWCAFQLGDIQTSITENSKAFELGSELGSQALMNRAQAYMRLGNYQMALADFDTVIRIRDEKLAQAYHDRAQLLIRLNRKREALQDLKRVVELEPKNIQLAWDVGRLSYDLEEYTDALSYYSKAINRIDKPQAQMLLVRGEVFEKLKNYEAAIQDYTRVIEMKQDLANAHYLRGQATARLGNAEEACVDWKKAAELGHEEAKGVIVYNCK